MSSYRVIPRTDPHDRLRRFWVWWVPGGRWPLARKLEGAPFFSVHEVGEAIAADRRARARRAATG